MVLAGDLGGDVNIRVTADTTVDVLIAAAQETLGDLRRLAGLIAADLAGGTNQPYAVARLLLDADRIRRRLAKHHERLDCVNGVDVFQLTKAGGGR